MLTRVVFVALCEAAIAAADAPDAAVARRDAHKLVTDLLAGLRQPAPPSSAQGEETTTTGQGEWRRT